MSTNLDLAVKYSYPNSVFGELDEFHEAVIATTIIFPEEVKPLSQLGVDVPTQNAVKILRRSLVNDFADDEHFSRAEGTSKLIGKIIGKHVGGVIDDHNPFDFNHGTLGFDDVMISIPEPVMVIDHGIGLNGLISHKGHVKQRSPRHTIFASAVDDIQACGLEGLASTLGFPDESFVVFPGADEASEIALDIYKENSFDLALLSRIHGFDKRTMKTVARTTPLLLKPGGVVVVRSPQEFSPGFSAQQQEDAILANNSMRLDKVFSFPNSGIKNGDLNPQQAFVIRKIA